MKKVKESSSKTTTLRYRHYEYDTDHGTNERYLKSSKNSTPRPKGKRVSLRTPHTGNPDHTREQNSNNASTILHTVT